MLYDITLRLAHEYDFSADVGRHLLRLTPREIPGLQKVLSTSLICDPQPVEISSRADFYGNICTETCHDEPHLLTRFEMRARVERGRLDLGMDVSPRRGGFTAELRHLLSIAPDSPHHCLAPSPRVPVHAGIAAWAAREARNAETAFAAVDTICRALHRTMTFDATATLVDTPLEEAFRLRRGVCQDFTHIAICALRSLDIPAGYVSGFLRTIPPEGEPRLEGADAMHAWLRAWCGADMGWVEFDPTNAIMAGEDHIVIAYGRDYSDVSPVKGALRMAGGQRASQAVDVVAVD